MNDLPYAVLALGRSRFAVKILADHHVGRQGAPGDGDFAIRLLEKDLAVFVFDLGGTPVPLDRVERVGSPRTEIVRNLHGTRAVGFLIAGACGNCGRNTTVCDLSLLCTHHAFLNKILRFCTRPPPGVYSQKRKTKRRSRGRLRTAENIGHPPL